MPQRRESGEVSVREENSRDREEDRHCFEREGLAPPLKARF